MPWDEPGSFRSDAQYGVGVYVHFNGRRFERATLEASLEQPLQDRRASVGYGIVRAPQSPSGYDYRLVGSAQQTFEQEHQLTVNGMLQGGQNPSARLGVALDNHQANSDIPYHVGAEADFQPGQNVPTFRAHGQVEDRRHWQNGTMQAGFDYKRDPSGHQVLNVQGQAVQHDGRRHVAANVRYDNTPSQGTRFNAAVYGRDEQTIPGQPIEVVGYYQQDPTQSNTQIQGRIAPGQLTPGATINYQQHNHQPPSIEPRLLAPRIIPQS